MSDTPPILPYATPSDTGVPEQYGPVEAMLDARCRPKDIRVHFRKAKDAVDYFARSMGRRFAIERVGHVCEVCGEVTHVYATLSWTIQMPHKKLEVHLMDSTPSGSFQTHHAVCDDCCHAWHRRMNASMRSRAIASVMMVMGMLWLFISRRGEGPRSLTSVLIPATVLIAGLLLFVIGHSVARLAIPAAIRRRLPPKLSPDYLEGPLKR